MAEAPVGRRVHRQKNVVVPIDRSQAQRVAAFCDAVQAVLQQIRGRFFCEHTDRPQIPCRAGSARAILQEEPVRGCGAVKHVNSFFTIAIYNGIINIYNLNVKRSLPFVLSRRRPAADLET